MGAAALERLELLLTGIYDLRIGSRVEDFLVTERQQLPDACRGAAGDEQLFVTTTDDELCMSLFLDPEMLDRLQSHDPNDGLDQHNVADCWTDSRASAIFFASPITRSTIALFPF